MPHGLNLFNSDKSMEWYRYALHCKTQRALFGVRRDTFQQLLGPMEGILMTKKLLTVIPELDNAAIRRTPDSRCSVYDLIAVTGGQANPRDTWKTLVERHPEVVGKTDNFKFPGRGQRETPVTDREGWAYILGLLPGVMGRKYREPAANLVVRYLDGDIKLAAEVVDRNENQQDLEWLETRVRGKITRKRLTGIYKNRGVAGQGYGTCTNKLYIGLYGTTAKGLRALPVLW